MNETTDVAALRERVTHLEALERARATRTRRRLLLAVAVGVLGSVGALAADGNCPNGMPVCFTANSPASASDVNYNFAQLKEWLEQKVGTRGSPNVTITGNTTIAGNTTVAGSGGIGGNLNVGGSVAVAGALSAGCPQAYADAGLFLLPDAGATAMVDMGAYCVMYEAPSGLQRGTVNWYQANEFCVAGGLRLCTWGEVSAAVRLQRIRQYTSALEGNYWAWIGQTASDNNLTGEGGCHVELTNGNGSFMLGEVNCANLATATNGVTVGLCCF